MYNTGGYDSLEALRLLDGIIVYTHGEECAFHHVDVGSKVVDPITQKCRELLNKAAASFPYEDKIIIKTEKTGKYGRWIVHIQGVTDELAKIWPYGD